MDAPSLSPIIPIAPPFIPGKIISAVSMESGRCRPESEPQRKTARDDDVKDRRAGRGNREAAGTRAGVTDLAAEAEPRPRVHVDAATELQGTRIRVRLTRVRASVTPQPGGRGDGQSRGDASGDRCFG
jgi:hypothetical protein